MRVEHPTYDYSCLERADVLNATCLTERTGGTHVTPTNHCHPARRTPPDTNGVGRTGQWSQTNRPMECLAESKEGRVCVARACYGRATGTAGRTAVVYWLNAPVPLTTTTLYQHGSRRHAPTNMHGMHAAAAASTPPPPTPLETSSLHSAACQQSWRDECCQLGQTLLTNHCSPGGGDTRFPPLSSSP